MSRRNIIPTLYLTALALLPGCSRLFSRHNPPRIAPGESYKAYEGYLRAVAHDPGNDDAAEGLRVTAPLAAAHWQRQALAAAESGQWKLAAQYHRKVLQIKPNDLSSILALRQIARQHPEAVRAVRAEQTSPTVIAQLPPPPIHSEPDTLPDNTGSVEPSPTSPLPPPAAGPPPASLEPAPQPAAPMPAIPGSGAEPPPPAPIPYSAVSPAPAGTRIAERSPPTVHSPNSVTAEPLSISRPAASRPAYGPLHAADLVNIDPFKQKPSVRRAFPAPGDFLMILRLSKKDRRYAEMTALQDGLAVKIKNTRKDPDRTDLEIYLKTKRIAKVKKVPVNSAIDVVGLSCRRYEIVVMNVYDSTKTITIGFRRPY